MPHASIPPGSTPDVPSKDVRAVLERVLAWQGFHGKRRGELLRYLVEQRLAGRGDTIGEYAIAQDVFHKPESFDPQSESTIRAEMSRLRKALAEYYEGPGADDALRFEFPARGYTPSVVRRAPAAVRRGKAWRMPAAVIAAAVLAAGGAVVWRIIPRREWQSAVILPFSNLTGSRDFDYLADGITEGLTDSLSRLSSLRIVARTSAYQFKGKGADVREIGRKLSADIVIEGSVRKDGERFLVTVQVNRAKDGYHLLSKTLDGTAADLANADSALSPAILAVVRPRERLPLEHSPDPEAWKLLLEARALNGYATPDNFSRQVDLLDRAIRQDPGYPLAYAELARVDAAGATNGFALPLDLAARARAAAERAIQLDPNTALAWAAEGFSDAMVMLDWRKGEQELRHAIGLMPQSAVCHQWLGLVLLAQGNFDGALGEARTGAELDPLSPSAANSIGMVYFLERHYDQALAFWQDLARAQPDALMIHRQIGLAWEAKGDYRKAMQEFTPVAARYPGIMEDDVLLLEALSGSKSEARERLRKFEKSAPDHYFTFAVVEGYLGNRDAAFAWLTRTFDQRGLWLLKVYPFLDPLRDDPRYAELLKRSGLAGAREAAEAH